MSQRVCKRCGRKLPSTYNSDICEHCKAERNETGSQAIKGIGVVVGTLTIAGIAIKKLCDHLSKKK